MTSGKDHGESPAGSGHAGVESDPESDGAGFESWLRQAARAPQADARNPLPQPGRVIGGKYRIEEQLGRGGMGAVYRATHVVSDKQVALKWMLRPTTDERAQQRFTREARAAGRIDHPNVVDVYDIGQDGEASYLVMELLRGEPLRNRLARGPLTPTQAVDLLLPAMRGVSAAHREGVVHRDLKPDNIFLCRAPDGAEREAKVLDFGISSINAPDYDSQTTLTKEGTVLGTPTYMSPEQLESSKAMDARTDVYAFGVILYETLTGSVPFAADSYSALVLAIANTKPKPPRELRPEIPVALEQLVLKAMDRDRAARVQTMDALIAALLPFASVKSSGSGEHVSVELQRATLPSVRRTRGRAMIALAIAAVAVLAWLLLRGGTTVPTANETGRAVGDIRAPAAPTQAPQPTAIPDNVPALAQPAATPAAQPTAEPTAPTATVQARTPSPTAPRPAKKVAASTPTGSDPTPSPAKKARSGSIAVDDL